MLSTSDGQEVRHAPRQTRDVCCRHKPTRVATACPTFTLGTRVGVRCLVAEAGQSEAASSARPRDSARRRNWCLHPGAPHGAPRSNCRSRRGTGRGETRVPCMYMRFSGELTLSSTVGTLYPRRPGPRRRTCWCRGASCARAPRASQLPRWPPVAEPAIACWYGIVRLC